MREDLPRRIGQEKLDTKGGPGSTGPALIGRDVPGMELTMKLNQETQEVLPVMTSAATRKEMERQAEDDKASEESGAEPIAVEDS